MKQHQVAETPASVLLNAQLQPQTAAVYLSLLQSAPAELTPPQAAAVTTEVAADPSSHLASSLPTASHLVDAELERSSRVNRDRTSNIRTSNIRTSNIRTSNIHTSNIRTFNIRTFNIRTASIGTASISTANLPTASIGTNNIPTAKIRTTDIPTSGIPNTSLTKRVMLTRGTASDRYENERYSHR
jgi:hypothetical protein